ncbi:hypothetical protein RB195_025779 [Necator americanus]|uniref:ABC transporter domain-containing protein n=1 Tax=Necator americanus TaxID=51031 RepID=A0ABR1ETU9_NECAM
MRVRMLRGLSIRYKHVSVRNSAEESAFYNAAEFEESESNRIFMRLLKRQLAATLWKYPAQFLQNFFDFYGAILSYVIQVFPIFIFNSYQDLDAPTLAQQISNNAFFFIYLINSFTRLTDLALDVGEMAGYTQRIAELVRCMKRLNDEDSITWTDSDDGAKSPDLFITKELTYSTPGGSHDLVSGLNFKLSKSKTLLITGNSGVGKSSLVRIIRKLWEQRSGAIIRNFTLNNTMFIPQRPYLPPGQLSLRQQVVFPQIDKGENNMDIDNTRIINILQALHLRNLISMCGGLTDPANFEWQDTLSPGEQQRLSIARILYHKPSFVFLDEATSSLSTEVEATVYGLLREQGISYVSTGHRPSLRSLHDVELHLGEEDDLKIIDYEQTKF